MTPVLYIHRRIELGRLYVDALRSENHEVALSIIRKALFGITDPAPKHTLKFTKFWRKK